MVIRGKHMTHYSALAEYLLLFNLCHNKQMRLHNTVFTDSLSFSFFWRMHGLSLFELWLIRGHNKRFCADELCPCGRSWGTRAQGVLWPRWGSWDQRTLKGREVGAEGPAQLSRRLRIDYKRPRQGVGICGNSSGTRRKQGLEAGKCHVRPVCGEGRDGSPRAGAHFPCCKPYSAPPTLVLQVQVEHLCNDGDGETATSITTYSAINECHLSERQFGSGL